VYRKDNRTVIVIYVDDIFIFFKEKNALRKVTRLITNRYEARDLDDITYALGVKIQRNKDGDVWLNQKAYIESILAKYGLNECRSVATFLERGQKMSKMDSAKSSEEIEEMARMPYRQLIGSMHLALYTMPDIMHAVTKLSQFNANPGRAYWAKHVLRYLSGTKNYAFLYRAGQTPNPDPQRRRLGRRRRRSLHTLIWWSL